MSFSTFGSLSRCTLLDPLSFLHKYFLLSRLNYQSLTNKSCHWSIVQSNIYHFNTELILEKLTYIDDSVSIEKPHDSRLRVAGDTAAESCTVALLNNLRLGLGHEARLEPLGLVFNQLRSALPSGLHFTDSLNACHALWQLGLVDDAWLASCLQDAPGLVHTVQVGSSADVFPGVFRVDPAEVHGNVAEVKDGSETVLCNSKSLI